MKLRPDTLRELPEKYALFYGSDKRKSGQMRIHSHFVVCRLISVKEPVCIYIFLHGPETQKAPLNGAFTALPWQGEVLRVFVSAAVAVRAFAAAVVFFCRIRLLGDEDQVAVHCQLKSALAHEYELSGTELGLQLG